MSYDEMKELLYKQNNVDDALDAVSEIINGEHGDNSPLLIGLLAYHMGTINGKRSERMKRK